MIPRSKSPFHKRIELNPWLSQDDTEAVLIRSAAEALPEVLAQSHRDSVELLHVNCEGCEYDVVQGLGDTGHLARISQVQLATHLVDYEGPSAGFHEAMSLSLQVSVKRCLALQWLFMKSFSVIFYKLWPPVVWVRQDKHLREIHSHEAPFWFIIPPKASQSLYTE